MMEDNFEFKPITQGLGFDKKAEETKAAAAAPQPPVQKKAEPTPEVAAQMSKPLDWSIPPAKASKSITDMINALPPSIDFFDEEKAVKEKEAKVYKPIGRPDYMPKVTEIPEAKPEALKETETNVDVSLNNTLEKAFPQVGFRKPFFHQAVEVQPQFTEVPVSFTSAVLDFMVITGLTSLLLVGLILLTGIDLIAVVLHSRATVGVWLELGAIFMGVYLLYYMVSRGFWGSTLGDWAFDIQLGLEEDRQNWYYPYQVILRMVIIAATGFVLFPLLSVILRKDMAANVSKLRLYVKNY